MKHLIKFENIDNNSSEYDKDIRDIKNILLELEDEFPYIEISVFEPEEPEVEEVFEIFINLKYDTMSDDITTIFGRDIYSLEYNLNRSKFTYILMNCIERISNHVLGKPIVQVVDLFDYTSTNVIISFEIT
jgi:hypothetical protein